MDPVSFRSMVQPWFSVSAAVALLAPACSKSSTVDATDTVCSRGELQCVDDELLICNDALTAFTSIKQCAPGTCTESASSCPSPQDGGGGAGQSSGGSSGSDGDAGAGTSGTGGTSGSAIKRVFVTSGLYTGDLRAEGQGTSGINGADKLCNKHGANLGGTFRAWVSAGQGAFDRITTDGPWYRVDGVTMVFKDRENLKGTPLVPIGTDEKGDTHSTNVRVWTGTDVGGTQAVEGRRCSGWNGGFGFFGQYGNMNSSGSAWTNDGFGACDKNRNRLICFEL